MVPEAEDLVKLVHEVGRVAVLTLGPNLLTP